jgi:chitinase
MNGDSHETAAPMRHAEARGRRRRKATVDDEDEARQLSAWRVSLALLLVAAATAGGTFAVKRAVAGTTTPTLAPTWFAPYVDTTLTPTDQFQDPPADPGRQVVLGFVVSNHQQPCQPSWGGYYTAAQAATTLDLDRRVSQVRENGATPIVSFGGQANTELAVSCTNVPDLESAYASVIARYSLTTVDFDIEGAALGDSASLQRRSTAVAALQHERRAAGHPLAVWLTLPVEPDGLQADGLSAVTSMIQAGVDLAGVNAMTMDFEGPETDMFGPVRSALEATHGQLAKLYRTYGIQLSSAQVWNRLGATVMIGQNDTAGEVFTLGDARRLASFAEQQHLGRVSQWSLNRDDQCGSEFAQLNVHSNTCSGTTQGALAFSKLLSHLPGTAAATAGRTTPSFVAPDPVDNPATSPYPIWQPGAAYVGGYKVVREGYVYQAKWYNQGDDPAAQTSASNSPWELVGPVLPGEHAPTVTTLPAAAYPAWSSTATYQAGDKVLRDGLPYQAKYYNQGADPLAAADGVATSPWQPDYTVPGEPTPTS